VPRSGLGFVLPRPRDPALALRPGRKRAHGAGAFRRL